MQSNFSTLRSSIIYFQNAKRAYCFGERISAALDLLAFWGRGRYCCSMSPKSSAEEERLWRVQDQPKTQSIRPTKSLLP
jgi:hypothetical protein